MSEKTLSIIKPDSMKKNFAGKIISRLEEEGFKIIAQKRVLLTKKQAGEFYREHSMKPFFGELVNFMVSAPISVQVLQKEDAVLEYRALMGMTDPKDSPEGSLRKEFGASIGENAVHGSDNIESARREIALFFSELEVMREEDE